MLLAKLLKCFFVILILLYSIVHIKSLMSSTFSHMTFHNLIHAEDIDSTVQKSMRLNANKKII